MITIGCLGPAATFSHVATIKFAKKYNETKIVFHSDFKSLIEAFKNNEVDEIVVPISNSTGKAVIDVLKELQLMKPFYGIRELYLKIQQCLVGYGKIEDVKVVYSHSQGIMQCIGYLGGLNDICIKITNSTAEAVELASKTKDKSIAAIGSEEASKEFNIAIIERDINDQGDNITRFMLLNKNKTKPTGKDKTTLFFKVEDKAGSLEKVLHIFTKNKINMTMLSSLPAEEISSSRTFFVDADGHCDDENFKNALTEVISKVKEIVVLGSYPKAETI
ncbi:ACT domain-containing protein [Candidatus Parcubacteria bacterium]|nr:ACT domain-containing protein [Candidatus Parcubacteria bacterium]